MRTCNRTIATLAAAAMLGGAHAVRADEAADLTGAIQTMDASAASRGQGAVTGRIASDFESFAGSQHNSTALVNGMRTGAPITLTQPGQPPATFTPPTRPMGYGNVSTSLALAKYQLAQQGIANPTPEQLKTALNGGTITVDGKTVEYKGILQMRADGMGWGQIAHGVGTKLGPVVSGIKSQNAQIAKLPATAKPVSSATTGVATAGGVAKPTAADGRGVVTAAGAPAPAKVKGKTADGVTTANAGASSARGQNQGIVTAAGQGGAPSAQGAAHGRSGLVTASGANAAAAGGGPGNGKALGHAK